VTKDHQRKNVVALDAAEMVVPERVGVVMADVAQDMREGSLPLAVGAGLQVMCVVMDIDVAELAGPRGRHDAGQVPVRHAKPRRGW
jgi:putative transposase